MVFIENPRRVLATPEPPETEGKTGANPVSAKSSAWETGREE
jgi:hypothetical protein